MITSKRAVVPIKTGRTGTSRQSDGSDRGNLPRIKLVGAELSVSNLDDTPLARRFHSNAAEDALRLQEGLREVDRGTIGLDDDSSPGATRVNALTIATMPSKDHHMPSPARSSIPRGGTMPHQLLGRGSEQQYFRPTMVEDTNEDDSSKGQSKPVHNMNHIAQLGQRPSLDIYSASKDDGESSNPKTP